MAPQGVAWRLWWCDDDDDDSNINGDLVDEEMEDEDDELANFFDDANSEQFNPPFFTKYFSPHQMVVTWQRRSLCRALHPGPVVPPPSQLPNGDGVDSEN